MSEWIGGILLRFFAGGVLCALVMILTGEGAQREIARIGCAALMIILVFYPMKGGEAPSLSFSEVEQDLQAQVGEAQEAALQAQKAEADARLRDYIAAQSQSLGAPCKASIVSELTQDGLYTVRQVSLTFLGDCTPGDKEKAAQMAAGACGIGIECVVENAEGEQ